MKKIFILFSLLMIFASTKSQVDAQLDGMKHKQSTNYIWPTDSLILNKIEKWQDQKFGVIIHWGLYSEPGIMESWNLVGEDLDWINRTPGMTYNEYKSWYWGLKDSLNPVNFNPDEWADLMKKGGMRYMVFTTKHHEGFSMFDTKETDFSIMNGPFGKDPRANVTKHVFDAFRKQDFMIGAYFSKPDWHSDLYWWRYLPTSNRNVNYNIELHPERWEKFQQFTYNQIEELMTGYGDIDILWLDGGQVQISNNQDIRMDKIAAMGRKNQPGLLVVDRTVHGEFENYQTPEGEIPSEQLDIPWETCMGMNGWGWRNTDEHLKPLKTIMASLIEVVAKGGNYMLGVGPTGKGEFDEKSKEYILTIGKWLDVNGKAIYATRSAKHYNDGNVWFTMDKDEKTMYAIYALPDGQEEVPEVIEWNLNIPVKKRVYALQDGRRMKCEVTGSKVKIYLPKNIDRKSSVAFSFELSK